MARHITVECGKGGGRVRRAVSVYVSALSEGVFQSMSSAMYILVTFYSLEIKYRLGAEENA